jgi:hypothetical protein
MRSLGHAAVATVAALVALAAPAAAQDESRQTATVVFDQNRPGASSGAQLAIDYVNPADAEAKPFAVQKVVIAFAEGTKIDTSVPEACTASNAQLIAAGAGACPAGSRVGGGELDLDSGVPGPARVLQNTVTMLNNRGELILVLDSRSEPGTRIVARGVIDGATITTEVSPVPGGPPDGFVAIKRVRLALEARSSGGGGSYITTPASCGADGAWTNRITFTYRDGASQTTTNTSPCVHQGGECRRPSRFSFKLHRRGGTRVVRVVAHVNGKLAARRSGRDLGRLTLSGLPVDGRMTIRIVTTHSTGSKVVSTRSWNGCSKRGPRTRVIRPR